MGEGVGVGVIWYNEALVRWCLVEWSIGEPDAGKDNRNELGRLSGSNVFWGSPVITLGRGVICDGFHTLELNGMVLIGSTVFLHCMAHMCVCVHTCRTCNQETFGHHSWDITIWSADPMCSPSGYWYLGDVVLLNIGIARVVLWV